MATLLTGPRKSGRSLLGRIFVRKTGGRLFDDAEEHDEEALFHAWNDAQARRRPLLIVADAPPPRWAGRAAGPALAARRDAACRDRPARRRPARPADRSSCSATAASPRRPSSPIIWSRGSNAAMWR